VNRERATWIGAVAVLLIAGALIGNQVLGSWGDARVARGTEPLDLVQGAPADSTFREWFWESRSLDLAAQVGLIFVGALGIASLLPRDQELNK